MTKIYFLKPDTDQIRHQIRGILDSYSHEWDLLSELAQNSIDAIRKGGAKKGKIKLQINAKNRTIEIADNGVGINPSVVETLLKPFGTDKRGKPNQVGEKGVGLKFVIFSSSKFWLSTKGDEGTCTVAIDQASGWVESDGPEELFLTKSLEAEFKNSEQGTRVSLTVADPQYPLFDYSFEELIFLLRTKTALGDTGFIWNDDLNSEVVFSHIDKGGIESTETFDCKYLLPIDRIKKADAVNIDDFFEWLKEQDRSDQDKRRKLLNKVVFTSGKQNKSGREIRYWSCFVPRRETWRKLSQLVGVNHDNGAEDLFVSELPGVGFSGGFVTSTKGMPTGISIELKPRGSAGYVPNFFIIIDDPALKFDIGRKSVHGRQQGMLREIAYENFREYINTTRRYMGGEIDPEVADWNRDEVFNEVEGLPDLRSSKTRFVKRPNSQEATVAAMFFEQMGKGQFEDVKPLISGYKERYDLYAKWKNRRFVLEFKFNLAELFRDFTEERKMFSEINAVVVWEVTEIDRIQAERRGMTVNHIEASDLVDYKGFPNATKTLTLGDVPPIYVVELKPMLNGHL